MKKVDRSIDLDYFVYGIVTPDEWDYKEFGRALANSLKKQPKVFINFDAYKILGLISQLHNYEFDSNCEEPNQ